MGRVDQDGMARLSTKSTIIPGIPFKFCVQPMDFPSHWYPTRQINSFEFMFAKFETAKNCEKFNPPTLGPLGCDLHENYVEESNPGTSRLQVQCSITEP